MLPVLSSLHKIGFQSSKHITCRVFYWDKKPWLPKSKKITILENNKLRQGKENEEKLKSMYVPPFNFNTKITT